MRDNAGVGVECLMQLLQVPAYEGTEAHARSQLGALVLLEALLSITAIAKGLASSK